MQTFFNKVGYPCLVEGTNKIENETFSNKTLLSEVKVYLYEYEMDLSQRMDFCHYYFLLLSFFQKLCFSLKTWYEKLI